MTGGVRPRRHAVVAVVFAAVTLLAALTAAAERHATRAPSPPSAAAIAGAYRSTAEHPRVFISAAELHDLARRIDTGGTYSHQRFADLAAQVARDLAAPRAWEAAYSGCNLDTYLRAFSTEPQSAEEAAHVRADLRLPASAEPPAGAAVVASRLALYAALARAGATLPAEAPSPEQAAALAARILLAWADHGFRQPGGAFQTTAAEFCGSDGKFDQGTAVALHVSRGVIYSVHAQDLLMALHRLDAGEVARLDRFHAAMFVLLQNAMAYRYEQHLSAECDRYSNHAANNIAGLLATARLLDDRTRFLAALRGGEPAVHIGEPWTLYFEHAIYGEHQPANACRKNSGPNGRESKPFFETATVIPGEIDDRYRNIHPASGIGYPMFTLERLYDTAEMLRLAGFDAYGYRGLHGQSIELATRYYACFVATVGLHRIVTPAAARACPNAAQYEGKGVGGSLNFLIGAYRFPHDAAITRVEAAAKADLHGSAGLDSILFGRWRD